VVVSQAVGQKRGGDGYLIELKPHECFNEGTLATGLLPHDQYRRRIKWLLEILLLLYQSE